MKTVETRRRTPEPAPDLTDFMNDMFFGTSNKENKTYDLTGRQQPRGLSVVVNMGFDESTRSNSARSTQEWLEEAREVMAVSPARCDSPARHFGSPKFATTQRASSPLPSLERDPLSRSARRNRRFGESLTREILSKSAIHNHTKSHNFVPPSPPQSPSFSSTPPRHLFSDSDPPLPPRPSLPRKSRFQSHYSLPPHSHRSFTAIAPSPDAQPLSSSHDVAEPTLRRFLSHSNALPLSPPRNRVQSAHRRTISSSTCSLEKIASRPVANGWSEHGEAAQIHDLNRFLQEQRILIQKILNGDLHKRAKVVISGPSNSTASMVAAICYAWLLCYRQRESGDGLEDAVVPVMNVERCAMWNLKQAAWLFDHAGLDPASLLFTDEVDIESLRMNEQHSILVVGQDILSTTGEAGSQCTILTDNYCEDAYHLLQNPLLKKLLLAGILLDTQNLKEYALFSMARDSEAVQLLLAGSAPNYRYTLFDQLMQEQNATSFLQALLLNYGKHPNERDRSSSEGNIERASRQRKSTSTSDREVVLSSPNKSSTDTESAIINDDSLNSEDSSPPPAKAPAPTPNEPEKDPPGEKKKFFLFRWFGFGSK
ncbi:hypothetical protein K1719_030448 [Acacia pycnantha]|nr:hypothetical protein K1719_030448 [Acacia pycnantha]